MRRDILASTIDAEGIFSMLFIRRLIAAFALALSVSSADGSEQLTPEQFRDIILEDQTVIAASGTSCQKSKEDAHTLSCLMKLKSDDLGIDAIIEADEKTRNIKTATFLGAGAMMVGEQKGMQIGAMMLVIIGRTLQAFNPKIVRDQRGKFVLALVKGMKREENSRSIGGVTYSLNNGIFMTFSAER